MRTDFQRQQDIKCLFETHFEKAPELWCRAPGRVDLMGSHTDYNLGLVLTLPIECDTWVAARRRPDRMVRLHSANLQTNHQFELGTCAPGPDGHWGNYARGVAAVLLSEGLELHGFDGIVHSTVPMSSGLSSSAALECAIATAFEAFGGWQLDPVKKALLCQRAENQWVGVNCGILDQYTSCAGRAGCALLLDCRDLSSQPVKLPPELSVVICDTRFKRELAGSVYGERRAQCEQGARQLGVRALREIAPNDFYARENELATPMAKRCRFIVEENARVLELAQALPHCERNRIAALTADSFQGACDLYEIAAPVMHSMNHAMWAAPGVVGARQAGAGFGGCMVAFVEKGMVEEFKKSVIDSYFRSTGMTAEVFPVDAASGAGMLSFVQPAVTSVSQRLTL